MFFLGLSVELESFWVLSSHVTCSACALFAVRYTFLSAFVSDGIEMPHKCVKSADKFCYTCGEITLASRKCALTPVIRRAYFLYSGCKVGDQDNSWAPDVCFTSCSSKLKSLGETRKNGPVCSAHDMEGADKSSHRLLLLYGASYSERDYQ